MAVGIDYIDLEWTAATDNVGVVSYQIFQSEDNVSFTEIHESDGVTLAYTATGLTPETQYYFKQTAKDAAGNQSTYGNTVTATTLEGGGGYTYLLDDYPGAAVAYSLRKLRTGVVQGIMVRRDSDDQLVDVRLYDDPNKSIDLDSITESGGQTLGEWVGSGSAFIFNWYDQSGSGNNLSQSTEASQPMIVINGILNELNSNSALYFDRTMQYLVSAGLYSPNLSIFTLFETTSSAEQNLFNLSTTGSSAALGMNNTSGQLSYRVNVPARSTSIGFSQNTQYLATTISDEVTSSIHLNQVLGTGNAIARQITTASSIASRVNIYYLEGNMQELIIYPTDQSANRSEIETAMNATYNIWVVTSEVDAQLIQADNDNVSDTVIEINGVRSSVSDTAVSNLISRNVTVITS